MGTGSGKLKTVSLNLPVTTEDLKDIEIGTVVYLNGVVYTAREGVYKRVIEDGEQLPAHLHEISNANFHCSPAATRSSSSCRWSHHRPSNRPRVVAGRAVAHRVIAGRLVARRVIAGRSIARG